MKAYELLFFVAPTIEDETRLAVMKRIETTIAEGEGKVDNVEDWGKRKLAYPINDKNEGYYVLVEFKSAPSFPLELERVFGITDGIMRSIVIKHDEKKLAKKKAKAAETAAAAPAEAPADAE